jgi:integrase
MANIRPRKGKDGGIISYEIRVYRGRGADGKQLKPHTMTWKVPEKMTAKQIEKELKRQELEFEKKCKAGFDVTNKQTFAAYAEYVLSLKEREGVKHRTLCRYRELLERINVAIGHIKIVDITPQHCDEFYEMLGGDDVRKDGGKATPKKPLADVYKLKKLTHAKLAEMSGVSTTTISTAGQGKTVTLKVAEALSVALGVSVGKLFTIEHDTRTLSNKTIVEHHRLIHTILAQAEKKMLIMFNPASKATPPKVDKKEANYFEVDDVVRIRDCLELIPLKWKVVIHLLLITGARRGEIAGLRWQCIDWTNNRISIRDSASYSKERGIYTDGTKTDESRRLVSLPPETMELLKEYRVWYDEQAELNGSLWQNSGFVFVQKDGKPMFPDSITGYCAKFSEKYDLPHINPHAFRHSQVAILYASGVDPLTISKRLGHSSMSFTADQYGHILKQADESAADSIADVVLRKPSNPAKSANSGYSAGRNGKILKLPLASGE